MKWRAAVIGSVLAVSLVALSSCGGDGNEPASPDEVIACIPGHLKATQLSLERIQDVRSFEGLHAGVLVENQQPPDSPGYSRVYLVWFDSQEEASSYAKVGYPATLDEHVPLADGTVVAGFYAHPDSSYRPPEWDVIVDCVGG